MYVHMSTASTSQKITFSKILVAIDGSDESMNAVDYAIFILSKEYNSAELLYALHVIHPAEVNLSFGQIKEMPPSSYYVVNINKEAQKYLDKVKLKANENNIQIKTEIIASTHVVGGIVDYAEDKDVDLIVVEQEENRVSRKYCLEVLRQVL
jgi:nucleotide-binding universal stress UspA family protein